jgi:hypothetical protein
MIEAPKLNYLEVYRWESQDAHLLAKYPLLRSLSVQNHRCSFPDIQREGLCRLIFQMDYPGEPDPNSKEASTQSLINTRAAFPNVLCRYLDAVTALRLVETALAPEMDFSFLTTLTIMCDNYNKRYPHDSDIKHQFASFWERFPRLKCLTLGGTWLGGLERDTFIELNWGYTWPVSQPEVPGPFIVQLIHYLGTISPTEDLSGAILPSLEDLVLQDVFLSSNLLTALQKFLESRSPAVGRSSGNSREIGRTDRGDSHECKITLRRCDLQELEGGPVRFIEAEELKAPFLDLRSEH